MIKKIFINFAASALLVSLLCTAVSCGHSSGQSEEMRITFTDALGREVSVKKNPRRVAALLGSFADIWVLSGGELCAAAEDAWDDFGLELDAVNIGGAHSPSLELLISSDPELVLASVSTAADVEMLGALESMGITVAYFDVDNFDDYLSMLNICTRITGRRDLYEKNGVALKERIDEIKAKYASADIHAEHRRVLLLRASSSSVKAKGSFGTVLGEMLSDLGCVNVADNDTDLLDNLSVEAVIRENPYHVFVVTMGSNTDKSISSLENMIKENPAWSTLTAIEENRLHVMDKALFNLKPNDRFAEAYETLYDKLCEK